MTENPHPTKREKDRAYYHAMIQLLGEIPEEAKNPFFGVEVGVAVGMLSKRVLAAHEDLHLWMVDTWQSFDPDSPYCRTGDMRSKLTDEQQEERYVHIQKLAKEFTPRAHICRGESTYWADVARRTNRTFSFVFIDADHSYEGVSSDLRAWWPLVRKQGLLCGHDYGSRKYAGVQRAVDEFAAEQGLVICTCNEPAQYVWYHFC